LLLHRLPGFVPGLGCDFGDLPVGQPSRRVVFAVAQESRTLRGAEKLVRFHPKRHSQRRRVKDSHAAAFTL